MTLNPIPVFISKHVPFRVVAAMMSFLKKRSYLVARLLDTEHPVQVTAGSLKLHHFHRRPIRPDIGRRLTDFFGEED